jgi:hypothetical protein
MLNTNKVRDEAKNFPLYSEQKVHRLFPNGFKNKFWRPRLYLKKPDRKLLTYSGAPLTLYQLSSFFVDKGLMTSRMDLAEYEYNVLQAQGVANTKQYPVNHS